MSAVAREETLFLQRIYELCERSRTRYSPEFTHFLDGRELASAKEFLLSQVGVRIVPFGGFEDAERCVIGVFPTDIYADTSDKELFQMFDVKGVCIKGSGFSTFSHRDVMGSVLALGIKREAMGDIYVPEDSQSAYICMSSVAAHYVCENLEFVSRDKVRCEIIDAVMLPIPERKISVISGTVASERLDCIVSLVTKISREKAKNLINSGLVNVNHTPELRNDYQLCDGDLLSIRGYGRFRVVEIGGLTRKGRNRIVVHKMI